MNGFNHVSVLAFGRTAPAKKATVRSRLFKMVHLKGFVSSTRIVLGLIPGIGALILLRLAIHHYRTDIEDAENRVKDCAVESMHKCYDFIVIGAGSAGAVVANRLSENPNWNVLVLEAGSDENVLADVPVLFPVLQTTSIDWKFRTEPDSGYCLSMIDGTCKWPRGKVLGGSSVLNAMLYIRGNRKDYDKWAAMGNPGWSYTEVLPYFKKSEDMRIPEYANDTNFHGTGGYLTIEHFRYEQPITQKLLEAGEQLGYKIRDVNSDYQTGFTPSHATVRDGLRCSTAKAFLRPAASRPNLHISMFSHVKKILIDDYKRAYGVLFEKNGEDYIVTASKEVILSAGAIQSPQLLMLSGVGDAVHLREVGVHPVHDLKGVGQNLQDHVAMGGHSFLFDNPNRNGQDFSFNLKSVMSLKTMIDFTLHRRGPLYSMPECEAMAFVNSKYANPAEDYPDVQLFLAPVADNMDGGLFGKRANGLDDDTYAELYEDILFHPSYSVVPLLLQPKSRGYVKLKDSDPHSHPLIHPNYYTDPRDIKIIVEGARIANALAQTPVMRALNSRPNPRRNPGCEEHELMSDEHLECQARHHTLTLYHPVGTCAMGPAHATDAVVSNTLKVHGIRHLRVVDASIMPIITNGNTNAPTIMIAEKASDMIKQEWTTAPYMKGHYCTVSRLKPTSQRSEEGPTRVSLNLDDSYDRSDHPYYDIVANYLQQLQPVYSTLFPYMTEYETTLNDMHTALAVYPDFGRPHPPEQQNNINSLPLPQNLVYQYGSNCVTQSENLNPQYDSGTISVETSCKIPPAEFHKLYAQNQPQTVYENVLTPYQFVQNYQSVPPNYFINEVLERKKRENESPKRSRRD